nr:hypothetical protein [Clostridia bacterium]
MKKILTSEQLERMDSWMRENARPYDLAKWNYINGRGSKDGIITELLRYQNPDGGFGQGFEADMQCPMSAAIPSAEAIFQAYEYGLDCTADWFLKLLGYFENTVSDNSKYWEDYPKEAMAYPHAPWWNYSEVTGFSPNPCAVTASALIRYGSESQKKLGYKITADCLELLESDRFCGDHDTLNINALVEQLIAVSSPLATDEV